MKALHARWGRDVQFVDILVRQAHPGPRARPYRSLEDKLRDAARYQREEQLPWPVAADDLAGTVHRLYGTMSDPTYLVDADGNVAFYDLWTSAPVLDEAIAELVARGGRGIVRGGLDRTPHLAAALTDGWRGLSRGSPQSIIDLTLALPGSGASVWLGHVLKPVLRPLTLRSERLPRVTRWLLGGVAIAGALLVARRALKHSGARRATT